MTDDTETAGAAGKGGKAGKGGGKGKGRAKPAAKAARAPKAGGAGKAKPKAAAAAVPVTGPVEGGTLRSKHLLDRVAARAGVSRAAAKPLIDAVLMEIGESLDRGEAFNLAGLGKGKVKPRKEEAKGAALTLKVVRTGARAAKKDAATPLAPTED